MAEDYKLIDNEEKHRYIPKSRLPLEEEESVHSLQKRYWRILNDKIYA